MVLAGCRERQTGPDANYEKGSRIYQQLYAQELDDAYGDPKMNEAAELLKKVDPRSVDADSARRMLASIDSGRALLRKQQSARNQMAVAAAASFAKQQQIDPQQVIAANTPDAGPAADPYGPGAAVAEINASSGGCLTAGEPFREKETNVVGTVYRVGKAPQCAERLPGLMGQVVLVGADGHVYRRLADPTPAQAPTSLPPPPDAGAVAAAPDAGTPAAKPKAPPAAAAQPGDDSAADAGAQLYIPGMPMPEGMAQSPPPPDQQQ